MRRIKITTRKASTNVVGVLVAVTALGGATFLAAQPRTSSPRWRSATPPLRAGHDRPLSIRVKPRSRSVEQGSPAQYKIRIRQELARNAEWPDADREAAGPPRAPARSHSHFQRQEDTPPVFDADHRNGQRRDRSPPDANPSAQPRQARDRASSPDDRSRSVRRLRDQRRPARRPCSRCRRATRPDAYESSDARNRNHGSGCAR